MDASHRKDISAGIQERLAAIFHWLIDQNDLTAAEELLSMGQFDFGEGFEALVLYANEKQQFDLQLLLMNYKNANGGYDSVDALHL